MLCFVGKKEEQHSCSHQLPLAKILRLGRNPRHAGAPSSVGISLALVYCHVASPAGRGMVCIAWPKLWSLPNLGGYYWELHVSRSANTYMHHYCATRAAGMNQTGWRSKAMQVGLGNPGRLAHPSCARAALYGPYLQRSACHGQLPSCFPCVTAAGKGRQKGSCGASASLHRCLM